MDYGLIGKTLTHSFSAQIHPKLFDCDYRLCELELNELESFFEKRDFKGINVTIPYKTEVIKYLDDIEENAGRIGAVNTIINKNGKLTGYNTDFFGLKALISSNGVSLKGKNVLILGTGATSKTARAAAFDMGAESIRFISRSKTDNADTYENIGRYYDTADIIINTTPCGMYPNIYESAVSLDGFTRLEAVFDVVYNPIHTKLVCDAKRKGLIADGGIIMLVFQAVFAARLFSSLDIPDSVGFKIVEEIRNSKENIVLIGMPSSGKTTIGSIIAEKLNREFVDTDKEIEKKHRLTPAEIIKQLGETVFRRYETEIIKSASARQGIVLATGGGAVEREINLELLRENGKIVFLDRPLELLTADGTRPLSSTKEKLAEIYKKRISLYNNYADIRVDGDGLPENIADSVLEMIF